MIRDLEAKCLAYLKHAGNDVAHDLEHIRRVVSNARHLAREEGARLDVVIPAAWLHDCVHVPKNSPERSRASALAAAEAVRVLAEWGQDPKTLPAIAHAIEAHSFSAGVTPETIEAQVLQDADRLDALGAVGIARCLMLGGTLGRPFYVPEDPFCANRDPDDLASTIDHFYTKLLHVGAQCRTTSGRREAERRTDLMRRYLGSLAHELVWGRDVGDEEHDVRS